MITDWNILTAARTAWQEARGEPLIGQRAVAHVIINRRNAGHWGSSLSSVCLWNAHIPSGGQGFQFSGWRGQDPNFALACHMVDSDPLLQSLAALIVAAETEPDLTSGAQSYYAKSMPEPPNWAPTMVSCGQFGNQLFFKPKPPPSPALMS